MNVRIHYVVDLTNIFLELSHWPFINSQLNKKSRLEGYKPEVDESKEHLIILNSYTFLTPTSNTFSPLKYSYDRTKFNTCLLGI